MLQTNLFLNIVYDVIQLAYKKRFSSLIFLLTISSIVSRVTSNKNRATMRFNFYCIAWRISPVKKY